MFRVVDNIYKEGNTDRRGDFSFCDLQLLLQEGPSILSLRDPEGFLQNRSGLPAYQMQKD
jgi:hypothetical protein